MRSKGSAPCSRRTVRPAWARSVAVSPISFFFSSRRRHTRCSRDWSSDVCSSDLLRGILSSWSGEGGRPLYGTFAPGTGSASSASDTTARLTSSFRDVLRHSNKSDDRSLSLTAQLQKRFSNGVEFDVGYTYSHTEDLFSLTSSIASSNYRFTTLDGTIANRNLRTSAFDIPHKITASGTMNIKWGVQLSLIYIGQSGGPYTYVVSNDINGDGFVGNDPVYVPRKRADMSMDGKGSANSQAGFGTRSEERRGGEEGRSRWAPGH